MKTLQLVNGESQLMVKSDSFPTVRNKSQIGGYCPCFFPSLHWRLWSGRSDQEETKRHQSKGRSKVAFLCGRHRHLRDKIPKPSRQPPEPAIEFSMAAGSKVNKKILTSLLAQNNSDLGNFPVSRWLRLGAFTAEGLGSIPGWGTKLPQAKQCSFFKSFF